MRCKGIICLLLLNSMVCRVQAMKYLFLIAGQSNAVGKGDASLSPVVLPGTAFEYVCLADSLKPVADPVGVNELKLQQAMSGSAWPAFCRSFYQMTGDTVILVAAARDGSSCHEKAELAGSGTWAEMGYLFPAAVKKVNAAMKKTGLPLSGILWIQGERDANAINAGQMDAKEYEESLRSVIGRFRQAIQTDVPFFIVKTGYYKDHPVKGFDLVRKVQGELAQRMAGVYIGYDDANLFLKKGMMRDEIHYNQDALNIVGDAVANSVINKLKLGRRAASASTPLKHGAVREFNLRDGFLNFLDKAEKQKELRVAYLGGSITQVDDRYRRQATAVISRIFPKNDISEISAGIPGTDADLGACRVSDQLLTRHPDVVFVEFAVNGGFPEGMEGIIRKIKKADSRTDICFLYAATAGQLAYYGQGRVLPHIAELEKLADHYQIPSVHMALLPALLLQYGKLVPKGDPASLPSRLVFTQDGVHPLERGGNLYAGSIGRMMKAALLQQNEKSGLGDDLPPPYYADNWEDADWEDPMKAAKFSDGWKEIPVSGKLTQFSAWFPSVMAAGNAGDAFTVSFEGDAIGLFDIGGPEVGQLRVKLDGKEVGWKQEKGVRYREDDSGSPIFNRFNVNCNNRYRGQFFVLQTSPGRHVVTFSIDREIPDKQGILGPAQQGDITAHPDKYAHRDIYLAKVLVKGRIVHED
ncbi:protein of unknown function [bacterium A37T11]|nr:protein of unknown function [bacterium A37T11]